MAGVAGVREIRGRRFIQLDWCSRYTIVFIFGFFSPACPGGAGVRSYGVRGRGCDRPFRVTPLLGRGSLAYGTAWASGWMTHHVPGYRLAVFVRCSPPSVRRLATLDSSISIA